MMQSIASTKSDNAVFAASGNPEQDVGRESAFEQVFQQQTSQHSRDPKPQYSESSPSKKNEIQAAKTNAERITSHTSRNDKRLDNEQIVENENVLNRRAENESYVAGNENIQDVHGEIEEKSIEQLDDVKVDSTQPDETTEDEVSEYWLDLVAQLQQLAEAEQTTASSVEGIEGVSLVAVMTDAANESGESLAVLNPLANIQDVKSILDEMGLTSITELRDKLAELAIMSPQDFVKLLDKLKTNSIVTQSLDPTLSSAVSTENTTTETSNPLKAADTATELDKFSKDLTKVLEMSQLSDKELKAINQGLSNSLNKEQTVSPWLAELVRSKLDVVEQGDNNLLAKEEINSEYNQKTAEIRNLLGMLNEANNSTQLKAETATNTSTVTKKPLSEEQASLRAALSVSTEAKAIDKDLRELVLLPDDTLEKALSNIAQRVASLLAEEAKVSKKSTDSIGLVNQIVTNPQNDNAKDLLAALKTGMAEFKEQLASGREPGIDLKALVNDAIKSTTDATMSSQASQSLDQSLSALSQALSLAAEMNDLAQRNLVQSTMHNKLDSLANLSEAGKVNLPSQFDNKLDKAINLAKPDAHLQLAEKVRWMVNTNNLVAEIRLDPAELGSMHVKVSLSADSASVNFVVQSHQTRDALESAAPRLREMLAEKGIDLGQSTVRQDTQNQQGNQQESGQKAKSGEHVTNKQGELVEQENSGSNGHINHREASGGIDYFV